MWETQAPPQKLWTDKGKELYNRLIKELLKKNSVPMYPTENEEKSSIVERWNQTINRTMWKYFIANNTMTYINVLPEIIEKYNNTYHQPIRCTPAFARKPSSYQHVFEVLYGVNQPITHPKYKVGDHVRIVKKKGDLRDSKGEEIQGTFYEPELQKTKQEIYRMEKGMKKCNRNNGVEVYVKWRGYNNDFNSFTAD